MTKSSKAKLFAPLSIVILLLFVLIAAISINAKAATCRCTSPSPNTRTISATCTSQGYTETYCKICGTSLSKTNFTAKKPHSLSTTTTKYATCNASGTSVTKCSNCSYSVTNTIPATGNHSPATRTKTSATCTAAGVKETYCTTCSKVLGTSSIDKIAHNNATRIKFAPTCTTAGTEEVYCKSCNQVFTTNTLPVLNHAWKTVKNPTCGVDGLKECTRTGCTATEAISKTENHAPATRTTRAATCTVAGEKETYCTTCNTVLSKTSIDKIPHTNDTRTKIAPTCTTAGTEEVYCKSCNQVFTTNTLPSLGHIEKYDIKEPTCANTGIRITTCSRTDCTYRTETVIPATGMHISGNTKITKNPTCTEKGTKTKFCTVCNKVMSTESIPELNHIEVYDITEPTCANTGKRITTCSRAGCTYCVETTIPATGMHISTTKITALPTCTEDGAKKTYCAVCNKTLSNEIIEKYGHFYEVKLATCGTNGSRKCKRNGCNYTEVIPATKNHSPVVRTSVFPTCTEKGEKETYCKLCNEQLNTSPIPAFDHLMKITLNATCGNDGVRECQIPGCTYKENIAATGNHSPEKRIIKSATCTSDGKYQLYCTRCNEILLKDGKIEASHNYAYTQLNSKVHGKACRNCNVCEQEAHSFNGAICTKCEYFSAALCDHPVEYREKKTIAPTCIKDLTIETWCTARNKRLESKVINGIKGEHKYKEEISNTRAFECGARYIKKVCTVPGCNYSYVSSKFVHTADSTPNKKQRVVTEATCTVDGTYEIYCSECKEVMSTGTIPAQHKAPKYDEKNSATWPNRPNMDGWDKEHQVICTDCGDWFRVPHTYKYVSNKDGTHNYICLCGEAKVYDENCTYNTTQEFEYKDGQINKVIVVNSCLHCGYVDKEEYHRHIGEITYKDEDLYTGHSSWCSDSDCVPLYNEHVADFSKIVTVEDYFNAVKNGIPCIYCGGNVAEPSAIEEYFLQGKPYFCGGDMQVACLDNGIEDLLTNELTLADGTKMTINNAFHESVIPPVENILVKAPEERTANEAIVAKEFEQAAKNINDAAEYLYNNGHTEELFCITVMELCDLFLKAANLLVP